MATSEVRSRDAQLHQLDEAQTSAGATAAAGSVDDTDEEALGATMTLVEHLEELRRRMLFCVIAVAVGSVVGFIFWDKILGFLTSPLPKLASQVYAGHRLITHDPGEGFMIALKLAVAAGLALALPVTLYQTWAFIAPALTRRERKYAFPFTLLGVGLFAAGLTVGFVVLRYPLAWLIGFGDDRFLLLLDADSYFTFVAYFLLAFGLVFELPLVLTFMSLVGIVNSRVLRQKRMYILFGLWIAACFITPGADPYSPVIIGVALTILFELTILLMRAIGK
jgi:sec-independent protein translocase protein TatC